VALQEADDVEKQALNTTASVTSSLSFSLRMSCNIASLTSEVVWEQAEECCALIRTYTLRLICNMPYTSISAGKRGLNIISMTSLPENDAERIATT
jgi:hypothetical protein